MSVTAIPKLTAEEYLTIERAAEFRSEFHDGQMFAMAGGTRKHSRVGGNCYGALYTRLKGKPCQPYNSDMRILVEATGLYTYPDISVVCGPWKAAPNASDCLVNPTVIIEVLSPSTSDYDRGKKFWNYRQIPSLTDYILVSTEEILVEHYTRQDAGQWLLTTVEGMEASLVIDSLQISIPLSDLFEDLE